ncbi:gastric triacylglycerol lipase [Acyrthosiphon pisum]|uniref:Lipase n=1 Tax=Acyrthosiphon pisum TaxID=7029 RepID=A0A8R1W2S9_ACYPI|nr:gastric triacylglycerol lipase [Acyrthosiphon pisum]|eukprot:XP_001951191.1 PREDICTED: gastric triacylglycerol lipase [Acyrthosiphon pisum]
MQSFKLEKCLLTVITLATIVVTTCDYATCLESSRRIKEYGYPLMTYQVWTADKYQLGIERIPYSKLRSNASTGKPVLLLHGLYLSSAIFTINNSSLSFVLSDAGFDVWLFNARGVGLSRKLSIYKKPGSSPKMNSISWDFSFHEMGVYDMTTTIDFILKTTGYSKLDVVGYSLGTTISLACLTDRPEYNSKINKLVLMAPTSRLKSSGMPLNIAKQFSTILKIFLDGINFFPITNDPDTTYQLIRRLCTIKTAFKYCRQFIDFAQGINLPMHNDTVLDIVSEFPQPMSSKTLKHMLQLLTSGRFNHYDYGPSENLLRYRTRTAPDYDLSRVTAPTYVIYSKEDTLVHPVDVNWLITQLPNIKDVHYIDKIPFGHFSFSLSPNMKEVVNMYITNKLLDNNII